MSALLITHTLIFGKFYWLSGQPEPIKGTAACPQRLNESDSTEVVSRGVIFFWSVKFVLHIIGLRLDIVKCDSNWKKCV